jgi:hypothetical protein
MKKQEIFQNFGEFWHYTKNLTQQQTNVIFKSLPEDRQKQLRTSYRSGGWEDLFKQNQIDRIVDDVYEKTGINLFGLRYIIVIRKKGYYLKRDDWLFITDMLSSFSPKHTYKVIGDIVAREVDKNTVELTYQRW